MRSFHNPGGRLISGHPCGLDEFPSGLPRKYPDQREQLWLFRRYDSFSCLGDDPVSGQGATSGTNFTRSSEPASWMA
jgi:hypothetical protein